MLEHPFLRKKSLEALESLKAFEWVEPVIVKAKEGEDFISMMVEKGYPAPSIFNRLCMARLIYYHGGASRFIDTLACGILFKYSTIAEASSSPGVYPKFQRESSSFDITIAEATSLSKL
jgi:hypothetical protein